MHVLLLDVPVAVERLARTFFSDKRQREVDVLHSWTAIYPNFWGKDNLEALKGHI